MLSKGKFKINLVNDLIGVKRDPSVVYPDVSNEDWNKYKSFAQNSDGTIQSTWRGYLLESNNKNIVPLFSRKEGSFNKQAFFVQR